MSNARFSILQATAVKDKRISDSQFRTLAALGMYADENGWCFPKLATLGDDLGKSKQAVGRDTIALRKLGYLEVTPRFRPDGSRTSSEYRLIFDTPRQRDVDTPSTSLIDAPSTSEVDAINVPINEPKLRNRKSKFDLKNSDPAWRILAGEEITQEEQDKNIAMKEATDAFERDMKFNPLPWLSTKDWDKLSKFVLQEYQKDKLIFAKYRTWQQNEGKFVAMSNRKIKERPADFIACFPDFLAHSAMYGKKPVQRPIDLDDNGIPRSY